MQKTLTIGIIAHVDHGKTTLTDHLLRQGGAFKSYEKLEDCVMDSNTLEKERGITIFAKNSSIQYGDTKINIVDTPGHADFGSEVERILKMVDCVLLLVDAKEGPMPQTKFVLNKSLQLGLRPIVIINKIDRPDQRANEVINMVFDLFVKLNATDAQLDFPIVYTIARQGIAKKNMEDDSKDLKPLFDTILKHIPPYPDRSAEPLQLQITNLAYDDYIGRIGVGRITRGTLKQAEQIALCRRDGKIEKHKITKMFIYEGLKQIEVPSAESGEIVAIAGIPDVTIGETITSIDTPEPLPLLEITEPTLSMNFVVNDSPFAGKEGKYVTTRHLKERLEKELETNVGLHIEPIPNSDGYKVSGRGELHLSVLLENMRREGYEVQVSRPEVIYKTVNGQKMEPIEQAVVTVPDEYAGTVIAKLGKRRGEMTHMESQNGMTRLEYMVPSRGLLGLRGEFIMDTRGEGLFDSSFAKYDNYKGDIDKRENGVLISQEQGVTVPYALWYLQERGKLFLGGGVAIYEGMIIGENAKTGDIVVNPCKEKKLTNVRASGSDEAVRLTPHLEMTLEQALEFIGDDELVEITPKSIRLRKKLLKEHERRRAGKN